MSFSNLRIGGIGTWSLTAEEGMEIVQNDLLLSEPALPSPGAFSVSYTGP